MKTTITDFQMVFQGSYSGSRKVQIPYPGVQSINRNIPRVLTLMIICVIFFTSSCNKEETDIILPVPLPLSGSIRAMVTNQEGDLFAAAGDGGMYRSTDHGVTWNKVREWPTILVNCFTTTTYGDLFAGTRYGIFRSTDGGVVWNQVGAVGIRVMALRSTPDGTVFAGTDEGIYHSTDGGESWSTNLTEICSDTEPFNALVIDKNGGVWALQTYNGMGRWSKLYLSTDNGETWNNVVYHFEFDEHPGERSGLSGKMIITEDGMMLARMWGTGVQAQYEKGIARSTDGGLNWTPVVSTDDDVSDLIVNSEGIIFAGVGKSGIFRSTDKGDTWKAINEGLSDSLEYHDDKITCLAFDSDNRLFAGTSKGYVYDKIQAAAN